MEEKYIYGENEDEHPYSSFTLFRFCRQLMAMARKISPEEYDISKKSLGKDCRLYYQKQQNSLSLSEIGHTNGFICLLKEQIELKGIVRDNTLSIKILLLFGRANIGKPFETNDGFEDFT